MDKKYIIIIIIVITTLFFIKQKKNKSNIISVGIPCIPKHIKHLKELIKTINNQKLLPYEIIISLSEFKKKNGIKLEKNLKKISHANVKIITSEKKMHAGENRNICGMNCMTELISFIDADDLMCPYKLKILEDIYIKYNYDVIYANATHSNMSKCSNTYNIIKNKKDTTQKYKSYNNTDENTSVWLYSPEGKVSHGHPTMKTNIIKNIPMDINGYGEDTRYIHKLFKNNLNVMTLPDFKASYVRINNSSWK
jgi:hypothetical protein